MGEIKVSVIIPVYNVEKYLRQCLDSVLNQTLKEIEIICVDDGSTDASLDILREYERKDSRVKALCQKNQYAGVARNNGIKIAQGKYLVFLDSDDFFERDLLEVQYNQCETYGADIGLCAANLFDDAAQKFQPAGWLLDMQYIKEQPFNRKVLKNDIFKCTRFNPWTKMFSAEFVRREQLLFQDLQRANDCYFVMSALALAEKIVAVDKVLVHYRVGLKNNLQSDNASTPLACNQALSAVKSRLMEAGIYYDLAVGFRNNALDQCLYTVKRLADNPTAKEVWISAMNDRYLEEFELAADDSNCLNPKTHAELLDILGRSNRDSSRALSVVVAVYNVESYLRQCLDSLIHQMMKDIEILCINDGSTDGSLEILKEYAKRDSRIRIVDKKQNEGLLLARKTGVLQARGKYVMYVDADDYLETTACQRAFELIEDRQVDILQFTCGVVDHSGNEASKRWLESVLDPKEITLSKGELLDAFYTKRSHITSLVGKIFVTDFCKRVYAHIDDFHCFVGEDIFQFFYYSYFASSFAAVKTEPLYWYQYGLGVGNTSAMSTQKYELYCKMGSLCDRIDCFLTEQNSVSLCQDSYKALTKRMLEDCCRIYTNRIAEEDKNEAAGLLLKYWINNPYSRELLEKVLGKLPEKTANVPAYVKLGTAYPKGSTCPLVSVIIPVYNTAPYLCACLDSVINQTLKEIEIICVNDGSTDNSLSILEEYYGSDSRITIVSKGNSGLSSSRNVGLEYAQGEYVQFLDSDDLLELYALDELYHYAKQETLDILFFNAASFYESNLLKQNFGDFTDYYLTKTDLSKPRNGQQMFLAMEQSGEYRTSACLQLIKRTHLRENNISFLEGILHEDNLFTLQNLLLANSVARVNKPYYLRRVRENSIMTFKKRYINFYGYLRCFIGLMAFVDDLELEREVSKCVKNLLESLGKAAYRTYGELDEEERKKVAQLLPIEYFWWQLLCRYHAPLVKSKVPNSNNSVLVRVDEAELIRRSWTYRIGRFITFIPRKVRGGLRCYQEHGWSYTWHRILVHLHIKKY